MCVATVVALAALLSTGCNQDGVGIYYAISQEEKQLTSKISELPVHQVVEANGTVYALTGRTIWEQSGDSWNDIGGGYAYGMVRYDVDADGDVYAYFNYDDNNMDDGEIKSWNGSSWTSRYTIDSDADLFDIDGAFVLEVGGGGTTESVRTTDDFSAFRTQSIIEDVFDGTELSDTTTYYVISETAIYYTGDITTTDLVEETTLSFNVEKSGNFVSISDDGTNLYLVTSSGQVYLSTDASSWTYIDSAGDTPVEGSSVVVDIGGTEYLIIGTENGYYEMEVGSSTVVRPTQTASASTPDSFAANYPDLAQALVYEVYPSIKDNDVFYLATQNGLWKRTSSGEFQRQ